MTYLLLVALIAPVVSDASQCDEGLRDVPIAAPYIQDLSSSCKCSSDCNEWTATSSGGNFSPIRITASVPGDLITDLQAAGVIGDPLYDNNFLNSSIWSDPTWTYSTYFSVPSTMNKGSSQLVFDGIKMGARIKLNNVEIGNATSQFLRYTFDIKSELLSSKPNRNLLEVVFDPAIDVCGRFMACTGGWDWAPYTTTTNGQAEARTFTKGIWKHVLLTHTPSASAAISHIVPQIYFNGDYPTMPLVDGQHEGFRIKVRSYLAAPVAASGILTLTSSWGAIKGQKVSVSAGESLHELDVEAKASEIRLWWPSGMGPQPLYTVTITFKPDSSDSQVVQTTRTIGFRYFALVTGNDTDPDYVSRAAQEQGTESHGMYFRINGAIMWSRGANMIPMEELEGRLNSDAHSILVASAAEAGMNTLRVWGGGMFLPSAWYDACDELGIIVYHDMQYAQRGHSPAKTPVQEAELRHQIRRLSAHPSIVLWDGCNECQVVMGTDTDIYATFVMTVVAEEDQSRSIWPSCPAVGWKTGVRKLDSIPNGDALTTYDPQDRTRIETHGSYQHGAGFPAVNGNPNMQLFDANMPINVSDQSTGPGSPSVFASEFGGAVMSSFESMSATLSEEHWGLHAGQPYDECQGRFEKTCTGSNVMAQRNYPCDNFINVYFGIKPDSYFNTTGELVFKRQLYQCMLSQALEMKSNIETRRSQNQFGCIVWQYNEIWPTGGWGSIEYGTPVAGQVIGGRWKPLQYFYRRSLFADVMATCGLNGSCFLKNDVSRSFEGRCAISALEFATGHSTTLKVLELFGPASLPKGPGTKRLFSIDLSKFPGEDYLLTALCSSSGPDIFSKSTPFGVYGAKHVVSFNEIALVPPFKMKLPKATVTFSVAANANADGSVDITVESDKTALYVTLTTSAHGHFSDNAFAMKPGRGTLQFIPHGQLDKAKLKATLRIEHLQEHLGSLQEIAWI